MYYLKSIILALSYLNYFFVHIIKQTIHLFPILLALSIFLYLLALPYLAIEESTSKTKTITVFSLSLLGLFMN